MMLGSVFLASFTGLATFVISLVTGNSFLTSMAIYSAVGTVVLSATAAWSLIGPWLDGKTDEPRLAGRIHGPTGS